jgi:hypothetical protein
MMSLPLRPARAVASLVWLVLATPSVTHAQPHPQTAATNVFRRYSDRVIKLQVTEVRSGAKASIGSGFFVTDHGHVMTNYHVIAELVDAPDRYRAELIDEHGGAQPVNVLGFDVVHDLAVVGSSVSSPAYFALSGAPVSQGDRLYSLGHPKDLGLSIVEGTYNGNLEHTLYPRLHFTGAINPGMSGGPALTEGGRVIGVNVSTEGDEVSFLVPVDRAAALLQRVLVPNGAPAGRTLADVGRQLREYQDVYLRDMFAGDGKTVELGPYRLVTQPAPFFRCWGDARPIGGKAYEEVTHRCSTDDYVFVAGDQTAGVVELQHDLISTRTLNAARFFALYTKVFTRDETPSGVEEHVTSWRCATRNLRHADTRMRAVLCLRRYRKLGPLYDGVLRVAVLGRPDTGLVSTLTLSGVTFENVDRLSRRYLEHISWR